MLSNWTIWCCHAIDLLIGSLIDCNDEWMIGHWGGLHKSVSCFVIIFLAFFLKKWTQTLLTLHFCPEKEVFYRFWNLLSIQIWHRNQGMIFVFFEFFAGITQSDSRILLETPKYISEYDAFELIFLLKFNFLNRYIIFFMRSYESFSIIWMGWKQTATL